MNSTTFYVDCLCLLPLDFLYLSLGYRSILRIFRLVKVYQFWAFMDRTERHTNYPNLFRFFSLIHYLLVAFHWNACVFHLLHYDKGFGGAVCENENPSVAISTSSYTSKTSTSSSNRDFSSCNSAWHPRNYLQISRGCCIQEIDEKTCNDVLSKLLLDNLIHDNDWWLATTRHQSWVALCDIWARTWAHHLCYRPRLHSQHCHECVCCKKRFPG